MVYSQNNQIHLTNGQEKEKSSLSSLTGDGLSITINMKFWRIKYEYKIEDVSYSSCCVYVI